MVLDCFKAINDKELTEQERVMASLIIFYEDINSLDDIDKYSEILRPLQEQMFLFFDCGEKNLQSNTGGIKLFDWDADSNLVVSAVNNVAGKEIRSLNYLHWWTFISYYTAIKECLLTEVLSLRYKKAHGEKLEKYEKKFIQNNPQYFNIDMRSDEQKEADEYVRQLWGNS